MAPKFKVGEEVWVKDAHPEIHEVFSKGDIRSIDGDKVTVETSTGAKTQELVLPLAEIFKVNPEGDVPDHCQLLHLSPPTLLWNTIKRFEKDLIYTSVGDILVAVNPFQWITGLYGQERMNQIRARSSSVQLAARILTASARRCALVGSESHLFFFSFGSWKLTGADPAPASDPAPSPARSTLDLDGCTRLCRRSSRWPGHGSSRRSTNALL